jgi:hypothetical protein
MIEGTTTLSPLRMSWYGMRRVNIKKYYLYKKGL